MDSKPQGLVGPDQAGHHDGMDSRGQPHRTGRHPQRNARTRNGHGFTLPAVHRNDEAPLRLQEIEHGAELMHVKHVGDIS
jgi:hypothetical protein